ncbi:MAG: 3-deoxy-D-manno-octulosonic acid transferase [Deltaproteobacteria bacterium]|uniref:3-deoxy-D-manno-octulosonic acid transferase n=1 Tax=Desulfobacula sp. TaxID=2593537 RepID=UPI00199952F1|nr:3-deoxy-D-manno-octulosonic acid transferase [Candidatus Desulfobacula maris]MBL6993973.1 3-deoxy-D-manno-octulosonic acid transferase [Desulfobacula sp.]
MIFLYKTIINILFIIVLPFLPFIYLFSKKRRASLSLRLGYRTGLRQRQDGKKRIWVHALSLGEVISVLPFIKALKAKNKELDIVFTASTKTGFDMAEQLLLEENTRLIDQLGYFPFDLGYCVKKVIRQIEPDAVVIVETDLWPNFLYEMKKNKIPVILINARLSKRSLNGYLFFRKFSLTFFSYLSHIMAQTPLDKQRFHSLGINRTKISVVGNIKFDKELANIDEPKMAKLKARFGIQDRDRVWIAGSTHEGEEPIILDTFATLKKKIPNLKLILAPRDPKRSEKLIRQIPSHPYHPVLFSQLKPGIKNHDLIFIDRIGLLATSYAICDIAFIGGSMVPQGGHNPLEPAMFGKPVLFGPHMTDFLQISNLLVKENGACRVETASEMAVKLERILKSPALAAQMGEACYRFFAGNAGAVDRIINKMEDLNLV